MTAEQFIEALKCMIGEDDAPVVEEQHPNGCECDECQEWAYIMFGAQMEGEDEN